MTPSIPQHRPATPAADAALLAGVRDHDHAAWDAFYLRFTSVLLRDARRLGAPDAARADLVHDTIGAALESLADPDSTFSGSLLSYLRTSLRNRAANHVRGERRREARALAAAEPVAECAGVVAGAVSAYTLGLTTPAAWGDDAEADDVAAHSADPSASAEQDPVRALAAALAATLRPDERLLLERREAGAPLAEVAAALGITANAAGKRLARLRARLQAAAEAYADGLGPAPQRAVRRLLRRAAGADAAPAAAPNASAPARVPNAAVASLRRRRGRASADCRPRVVPRAAASVARAAASVAPPGAPRP